MLQAIRNNAQGVFVWIIVGLIVVSFALFGLGSYLSGASKVTAASVNGVEISGNELTRAYQNYQESLRNMFGEQYDPEMFGTARIKNEVLQGLITQEVMNQLLHEKGYKASANQVFEKLKKYEAFHEAGQFSSNRYKEVLAQQGMNEEAFENDLSRDIAAQQIKSAISKSAFLTNKEKQKLALLDNQKRDIGYFNVALKPYRNQVTVSDEDIKAHYEKNSQLYLTQEKVQLEYLELNMDDVASRQEVTEDMLKQHYESSPDNYMASDNIAANKKIADIRKEILNGADFAEQAKKHSDDKGSASQGGDLGYLTRGVEEKFDNVVFALKKGEVSSVVKSKEGFQLIKVEDIRAGDPEERKVRHILVKAEKKLKAFADVKEAIKKELQYQEAGKVFFEDADKLNNLSFETPDSLEPVAESLGLKLKNSELITRRGGKGLFANPKIIKAAFSNEVLKEGRNSELVEISDSHLVVLRIKQHQVAAVEPLDKVKARIKERLLREQAGKKAQDVTTDILARLKNNESIESVQSLYPETKWMKTGWIKRKISKEDKVPVSLPDQVRKHAFTMPKPEAGKISWDKLNLSAGDQAVMAVFNVETSGEVMASNDVARITLLLGNTDYNAYMQLHKSQADISVSETAIDIDSNQ